MSYMAIEMQQLLLNQPTRGLAELCEAKTDF
jgi:hypothetical protein